MMKPGPKKLLAAEIDLRLRLNGGRFEGRIVKAHVVTEKDDGGWEDLPLSDQERARAARLANMIARRLGLGQQEEDPPPSDTERKRATRPG